MIWLVTGAVLAWAVIIASVVQLLPPQSDIRTGAGWHGVIVGLAGIGLLAVAWWM